MSFQLKDILADRYGPRGSQAYDDSLYELAWHYGPALEAIAAECLYGRGLKPRKILDLGAGTGNVTVTLLRDCDRDQTVDVYGLDASAHMLDLATRKLAAFPFAQFHPREGLFEHAGQIFEHHQFDVIVSNIAVHHLAAEGKRELIHTLASLLRPGGALILGDRMPPFEHPSRPADYHRVFSARMGRLFRPENRPELPSLEKALHQAFDDDHDQPSSLEQHLAWMSECLDDVRCPFFSFGVAVVSGVKKSD